MTTISYDELRLALPEADTTDLSGGTFYWGYRAGWNAARAAALVVRSEPHSPYRDADEHERQSNAGTHLFDAVCYWCLLADYEARSEPRAEGLRGWLSDEFHWGYRAGWNAAPDAPYTGRIEAFDAVLAYLQELGVGNRDEPPDPALDAVYDKVRDLRSRATAARTADRAALRENQP